MCGSGRGAELERKDLQHSPRSVQSLTEIKSLVAQLTEPPRNPEIFYVFFNTKFSKFDVYFSLRQISVQTCLS